MRAYLLNILDLCFTLYALRHGAVELNPIMRCEPVMITYKLVVVGALLWWLSRRSEPVARRGLKICTVAFAMVNLWHILNLFLIGGI